MCKFRDLSIKHNPYYFDAATKNPTNDFVKELSIIFAIQQPEWQAMGRSNLDVDLTTYGIWVEEIHSALQNGFAQDGNIPSTKDRISSAKEFREFMFNTKENKDS